MTSSITFARFDDAGRYFAVVTATRDSLKHEDGNHIYIGSVDPRRQYHDRDTGRPAEKGEPPSDHHVFDYTDRRWIDPRSPEQIVTAQRLAAYPPIGDQLDAIWQGGQALEAMREQIMQVKRRYPKP